MRFRNAACALCFAGLAASGWVAAQTVPQQAVPDAPRFSEGMPAFGVCEPVPDDRFGTLAEMRETIRAYQGLVEESLTLRARAIDLLDRLNAAAEEGLPLSGAQLRELNESIGALLVQRRELLEIALRHECWISQPVPANPDAARAQAAGIAMSLSAALVLYDNYLSALGIYRGDMALRQHLNRGDQGYALPSGELHRAALSFNSTTNRARVRSALAWMAAHGAIMDESPSDEERYLRLLIAQSPALNVVSHNRPIGYVGNLVAFLGIFSIDTLNRLKSEGVNLSSMLFGNAVGLVEVRKGKLYDRPEVRDAVGGVLRAGDVLLEKTPFRLTDAFIPGHWGHVAVWVGDEDELRRLGIWEHPVVQPHHAAIREGRSVVEALRAGVKMNSLAHFLNVDDLAVLRQHDLADDRRAEVILQTLRQVGKAYDFNFDVESTDRIVCSELVYHAYGDIRWPVARHLGRATISPDNVAVQATGDGPFEVLFLYHDGDAIPGDLRQSMARLVKRDLSTLAQQGAAGE